MSNKIFIDTNILVSAYDRSEPEKQKEALKLLDKLAMSRVGVISSQVLNEFFIGITQKMASPLSLNEAYKRVQNHMQTWMVVDQTAMIVLEAVRGVRDYSFNFWEAQIWATARLNQIQVVFTEELNVGQVIEGVEFVDPFSADFKIERWM